MSIIAIAFKITISWHGQKKLNIYCKSRNAYCSTVDGVFFHKEITNNKFYLLLYFRDLASKLWQQAKLKYNTETLCDVILRDVVHPIPVIQQAGAQALAALLKDAPSHLTDTVLKKLLNIYHEKMAVSIIKICYFTGFH